MPASELQYLPREIMEAQLSQIDLLMAMYPTPDELLVDAASQDTITRLRSWCEGAGPLPSSFEDMLSFTLKIPVDASSSMGLTISLVIDVALRTSDVDLSEPPPLKVRIRQPEWMSKAQVAELAAAMQSEDDVFSAIDYVREAAPKYVSIAESVSTGNGRLNEQPVTRVWFYFPSLSTREKRDDLVNHAPGYRLTGFVLAGKPGVLCLEGISKDVDAYMKFIKTTSWSDIPSHQKKVSERFREEGGNIRRAFTGMQEITDLLGEKRGERANRGDMKALEVWLGDKGLGEAFQRVLM